MDFNFGQRPDEPDDEFDVIELTIDKKPYVLRIPDPDAVMAVSSAFGGRKTDGLPALRTFLVNHFIDGGGDALVRRWEDPDDPFNYKALLELVQWAMEQAADHPSEPSSASAPSPRRTGTRSTAAAQPKASTRASSRRVASTT